MDHLDIRSEPLDGAAATRLVAALQAEFVVRYGGPDDNPTPATDFAPPSGTFLVVYRCGEAVACGGVRRSCDGIAELKRMYVVPGHRRAGIARRLLAALERAAAELGYRLLRLETGTAQPEAMALYASSGYRPIDNFGYYAGQPLSRSFQKRLRPAPGDG